MDPVVERILALMDSRGINQKMLAAEIKIRPQAITEWKKGVTASYRKFLPQIANFLGTSAEYLLTGEEKNLPAPGAEGGQVDKLAKALADAGVDLNGLTDQELRRLARTAAAALDR